MVHHEDETFMDGSEILQRAMEENSKPIIIECEHENQKEKWVLHRPKASVIMDLRKQDADLSRLLRGVKDEEVDPETTSLIQKHLGNTFRACLSPEDQERYEPEFLSFLAQERGYDFCKKVYYASGVRREENMEGPELPLESLNDEESPSEK